MTTLAIVLGSIAAWLAVGYAAGRDLAPRAYYATRREWPSLAYGNPREGRGEAIFALWMSVIGGPISAVIVVALWLIRVFAVPGATNLIPELAADEQRREEEARKRRLDALQRQIDAAHRELGIAPLKRDIA